MSGDQGGLRTGLTYLLAEIDPDTLPEEDIWPEIARRAEAWREGRSGWRTGDIQSQIGGNGDEQRCRT